MLAFSVADGDGIAAEVSETVGLGVGVGAGVKVDEVLAETGVGLAEVEDELAVDEGSGVEELDEELVEEVVAGDGDGAPGAGACGANVEPGTVNPKGGEYCTAPVMSSRIRKAYLEPSVMVALSCRVTGTAQLNAPVFGTPLAISTSSF